MTVGTARPESEEREGKEPPFPPALVEELVRAFVKAMRAHQLYLHNNPSYLRAIEVARAAFARVWEETDELRFDVSETELRWEDVAVLHAPEKTGDSLPWLLFKDGIRELRFTRGFEHEELLPLLDIFQRVRLSSPHEDDLLTLLWEHELVHLRYRYVELGEAAAPPLERASFGTGESLADDATDRVEAPELEMPSGVVDMGAFDGALYFLDEPEIAYLRDEVRKEYESDLRSNVVSILLDTYEQQVNPAVRAEIHDALEALLLHLLSTRALGAVSHLLHEVSVAARRAREITPAQREALAGLADRLSAPEVLAQMLQALDDADEAPSPEELEGVLQELRGGALATVLAAARRLQSPRLRAAVAKAADRLSAAHPSELVRLVQDEDAAVVREAIDRAGVLRATAAVPAIARRLVDPDPGMRLAAVHALGQIASPGALQQLERTIDDPDRDVRVATARALAQRGSRAAVAKLEAAVRSRTLRGADLTEKMAMFDAYGAICGDGGVPLLDGILNDRGLLGRREDPELRACAAMALGRIGSGAALDALRRAANDGNVIVRTAVARAMRTGE